MFSSLELQIALWTAGAILAVNLLLFILHLLQRGLPEGKAREHVQKIIYEGDRFADNMSNSDKRRTAIQQVNELLGWRRIIIPSALIGWIIDIEVAVIRKMQAATDTPDLHKEDLQ